MLYGLISPARDARHGAENGFSTWANGRERGLLPVVLQNLVAGRADLGTMFLGAGQEGEIALVDHRTAELLDITGCRPSAPPPFRCVTAAGRRLRTKPR